MKKSIKLFLVTILSFILGMTAIAKDYSEYKTNKLISVQTASELIKKGGDIAVIDVRPTAKYLIGHIPGSFNLWRPDVEPQDKRYGEIGGMRASREEMEKLLGSMGITNKTTIVLYGDNLDDFRVWWILDLYGHENVKLIDGGYKAWTAANLPTEMKTAPKVATKAYKFENAKDKETLALAEEVKASIGNKDVVILDTRTVSEHEGKETKSGAFGPGRIPSNYYLEWNKAQNPDGTLKSYKELKDLYSAEGITPDKHIIAYCQSAVRSAYTTFVLKELLGYKNVKNYDGSWIEWSYKVKNEKYPVESGPIKK